MKTETTNRRLIALETRINMFPVVVQRKTAVIRERSFNSTNQSAKLTYQIFAPYKTHLTATYFWPPGKRRRTFSGKKKSSLIRPIFLAYSWPYWRDSTVIICLFARLHPRRMELPISFLNVSETTRKGDLTELNPKHFWKFESTCFRGRSRWEEDLIGAQPRISAHPYPHYLPPPITTTKTTKNWSGHSSLSYLHPVVWFICRRYALRRLRGITREFAKEYYAQWDRNWQRRVLLRDFPEDQVC